MHLAAAGPMSLPHTGLGPQAAPSATCPPLVRRLSAAPHAAPAQQPCGRRLLQAPAAGDRGRGEGQEGRNNRRSGGGRGGRGGRGSSTARDRPRRGESDAPRPPTGYGPPPAQPVSSENAAPGSSTTAEAPAPPPPAPEVGWMWGSRTTGGASVSGRAYPTAMATVADLKDNRIKAKKSLGQNFVTDDMVLRDIVAAARVQPGDVVLEVGPGTGNLTKHLLEAGARVTAVEKDDTLYARLVEQYRDHPNLTLVHSDVLQADVTAILRDMLAQKAKEEEEEKETARRQASPSPSPSSPGPSPVATAAAAKLLGGAGRAPSDGAGASTSGSSSSGSSGRSLPKTPVKAKVLSNLPYNITTDFLVAMLPLGELVSELNIMIQEEAAQRLCERKPGGAEWRAMNLRTLYYCRPTYRFRIDRLKYDPAPAVDGALVTFELRPPPARPRVPSERGFLALVASGFGERRKMLRNSLQPAYGSAQVEGALKGLGLRAEARAQDLSLDQFVALAWALHEASAAEAAALLAQGQGKGAEATDAAGRKGAGADGTGGGSE